jgi:hypothetical protein
MVPGKIFFEIALRSLLQSTLGRIAGPLYELSAALAGAFRNGALDCQHRTPNLRDMSYALTAHSMAWILNIIETTLPARQT